MPDVRNWGVANDKGTVHHCDRAMEWRSEESEITSRPPQNPQAAMFRQGTQELPSLSVRLLRDDSNFCIFPMSGRETPMRFRLLISAIASIGMLSTGPLGANATSHLVGAESESQGVAALEFTRLAGASRYDTAVEVSRTLHPDPVTPGGIVVLASGMNFPDALSAGPLAALHDAPVLLLPSSGSLPASVIAELRRLSPKSGYLLGGTGAVSAQVEAQVARFVPDVVRVAGVNRYETSSMAALLTAHYFDETGDPMDPIFSEYTYLANGNGYADALAGGAAASLHEIPAPMLLTTPTRLPQETVDWFGLIGGRKLRILGGTGAISAPVAASLASLAMSTTRLAGADRFSTAAAISRDSFPTTTSTVFLVNGLNYPDALAVAPSARIINGPVLLTRPECVPAATLAEISRLGATHIIAVGGPGAVSEASLHLRAC